MRIIEGKGFKIIKVSRNVITYNNHQVSTAVLRVSEIKSFRALLPLVNDREEVRRPVVSLPSEVSIVA